VLQHLTLGFGLWYYVSMGALLAVLIGVFIFVKKRGG